MGVPHRRPTFLQIGTTKRGRVLEDTVWGQGPWQPLRPSGSLPRRGAACSRAARILPRPPCPAELVRPRGSVTRSPEPAPRSPPPWMCADPGEASVGPSPAGRRPSRMDPGKGPCWAPSYRLIAAAIRTINNPLAILLTREVGGRKRSSRPALRRPAGPRRWQYQPARQPSPPRPSPHAGRPQAGREPGPQLLPHLGSGPRRGGQQSPPSRLAAAGRGAGRGGGWLRRHAVPPPPNPCLVGGARHTCPRPGLAVQACLAPGACRAETASCPGPTPHTPHPGLTQGPEGPAGPQRRRGNCSCSSGSVLGRGRRGRTAFAQINSLCKWGNRGPGSLRSCLIS